MLCNYFFYDFENLYNNKSIYKITKNLLSIIIRKRLYLNNIDKNMDKIVICLLNWINNEINIKEDISELIENISWNEISLPLLFEFIIKYGKNISEKQFDIAKTIQWPCRNARLFNRIGNASEFPIRQNPPGDVQTNTSIGLIQ